MQDATDTTTSMIDQTTTPNDIAPEEVDAEFPISVDIDVLGIVNKIQSAVNDTQDRGSFVKNLMESTYYAAGQQYNVMVFNLGENYQHNFNNVVFYGSSVYSGLTFGIWAFDSGTFVNQGDGGYINWAFQGVFNRNGNTVTFTKP